MRNIAPFALAEGYNDPCLYRRRAPAHEDRRAATIPARTVLEERRYVRSDCDHVFTDLLWEPRGHADVYGAVVTASLDADLDIDCIRQDRLDANLSLKLTQLGQDIGDASHRASAHLMSWIYQVLFKVCMTQGRIGRITRSSSR